MMRVEPIPEAVVVALYEGLQRPLLATAITPGQSRAAFDVVFVPPYYESYSLDSTLAIQPTVVYSPTPMSHMYKGTAIASLAGVAIPIDEPHICGSLDRCKAKRDLDGSEPDAYAAHGSALSGKPPVFRLRRRTRVT